MAGSASWRCAPSSYKKLRVRNAKSIGGLHQLAVGILTFCWPSVVMEDIGLVWPLCRAKHLGADLKARLAVLRKMGADMMIANATSCRDRRGNNR